MKDEVSPQREAAIRHAVYRDLLDLLPLASYRQTIVFAANLGLVRNYDYSPTAPAGERQKAIDAVLRRLLRLKVSPDLNCISDGANGRGIPKSEIEKIIVSKYGDRLANIAGFYFDRRWKINLPERCALFGYRNRTGFYTGILCQPIDQANRYFLFSSASFDGPKAIRLEPAERMYFEQWTRPAELRLNITPPQMPADLEGMKWTGRRFVEVN